MNRWARIGAFAALLLVAGAQNVAAQSVRGLLVDEHTGEPIALGKVMLVTPERDSVTATLTTEEGFYLLEAPLPGTYSIVADAFGYWSTLIGPITLEEGSDRIFEARVAARPIPVQGVTVEADSEYEPRVHHLVSSGFYDRMGRGKGEYITPGEIAMSEATYVQQLFYEKEFTRVWQTRTAEPRTGRNYTRSEARATTFGPWADLVTIPTVIGGYCTPSVYLDGIKMLGEYEALADLVTMDEVQAVEIYRAPFEIETEFKDLAFEECGALLFWTNR
ncbi:MAG: carboxypeptidase-like regulatory domain-containing protein [Gemmatimonadota bacterium]